MAECLRWVNYSNNVGFSLSGRARRREFWYNWLFYFIVLICISIVLGIVGGVLSKITGVSFFSSVCSVLTSLAGLYVGFIKMLPIAVRRFHDSGKSGILVLVCILTSWCCCIGVIAYIVILCLDSTPGDNAYGSNPKGSY